jgi:hypothetical protein
MEDEIVIESIINLYNQTSVNLLAPAKVAAVAEERGMQFVADWINGNLVKYIEALLVGDLKEFVQ